MAVNIISLHSLCEDSSKEALIKQLQDWNLIPRALQCPRCKGNLTLREESSRSDGCVWRCRKRLTKQKKKITYCEYKILVFVHCWVWNTTLLFIQQQIRVGQSTCVDWSSFCREVLLTYFMKNPIKLGGSGKIVEVDKYHKGQGVDSQWIFGAYERGSGRICMVAVNDRGADSLIPLIEEWIEHGTTIISDFWRTYNCLNKTSYNQLKVNRSLHYVDPDTDAHSNSIESTNAITIVSGRKKPNVPDDLARNIFYKKCSELGLDRTVEFFRIAGEVYNASCPEQTQEDDHNKEPDAV